MPTAEEILQSSLRGIDLPTATSAASTEYFFFWSNTNNRLEKLLKSNINTNPYFSYDAFGLIPSAGTTTTDQEIEDEINSTGFTILAGEVKFLQCNVLINSVVHVRVYIYLPNAAGTYGTTAGNEIAFANLFKLEELVLSQNLDTVTTIALGDIGSDSIEDYINANDDDDWNLLYKVIYIFTATISSVDYQYLYVGVQPQQIGDSYNSVTSDDFLELSGANISGVNIEGTDILSTGEAGGSKFLREDGDGTCSWQSIPGGGDMLTATYDPTSVEGDAFDMDNMVEGADTKILTAAERAAIASHTSEIAALVSSYSRRKAVIDIVDNTAAPPTEVSGDRYILDNTGASHANWDGASAFDIVEFDGTNWAATTPLEGYIAYVDAEDKDALYIDDGSPEWQLRDISAFDLAAAINGATNKATPVDADKIGIWDSVSGLLRNITWANIKATLKTYFDTLYFKTDAEVETAYNNQVSQVSGGEITAGTETAVRRFSPADVKGMVDEHASGGSSSVEYQTEITTSTTLDGSQKGLNKVYPVNSSSAVEITVTTGDYVANDVINIERRGQGSVEIIADTGVRIRGVRNSENKYFINDPNSMVALLCRGSEEFGIIGNLTRGYTGAVTTTSYGTLRKGDQAVDVTVTGTGFSENMIVTVSANATQSSAFTYVSATEITLHLSAVGNETDTVTVTYDNGDVFEDTAAIIIGAATYSDFVARYKMDEASGLIMSDETTNHDGDITEASINQTGKINKSYLFDGVNDYVNIPSTLGITAFPFTIKFWIKSSSYSGFKWILSFNDATKYSGFNIYSNGTNLATLIGNALGAAPGNRKTFETTDNPLIVDTWQQVIIRYTNISTIEIKIDNVISTTSSSGTATTIVFDDDTLDIGRVNRTSEYGNFEMDDLTVWDRLLTDTESNNIYTQESTGNEM